jgi:glycosyltransferase involved in cell wall biosynthesis
LEGTILLALSPTISLLVTVYNREKYIAETIDSILASRFTDFEIIIVDDRSSDGSQQIIRSYLTKDQRIRFVENEENLGDYGNRMKAASLAVGTYIKYLDSDDLLYPHTLDVMVDAMERSPDVAIALSHSAAEDDKPYPWRLSSVEAFQKHFLGRGCLGCGPSGAIIRRDKFLESGGFDKSWGVLSDTELWLRLSSRNPIVLLPPGLVWWRRHEEQEFSKGNAKETYLRLGYRLNMKTLESESCPLDSMHRKKAIERCKQHHARKILSLATRDWDLRTAVSLYQDSEFNVLDLLNGFRSYY